MATKNIKAVKENMNIARDRKKSYADHRHKALEFKVGDKVFLKLSPWEGVIRFGRKGKLSPRYIGPYKILKCVGRVAYKLRLPTKLSKIPNVFHVSMLRKYVLDSSHILQEQSIEIMKDLTYEERHLRVLDRKEQVLITKIISMVKVL